MSQPTKGPYDYLELGDWNAECAVCGRKGKASGMFKIPPGVPGAGMYAHQEHKNFWQRQPQDLVRGIPDNMAAPWVQNTTDIFAATCFPNDRSAIPNYATPGCVLPDYLAPGQTIFT